MSPERILNKNYEINQEQTRFVGQEIVKVKDYTVIRKTTDKFKPSNNFFIGLTKESFLQGNENQPIEILGTVQVDDRTYYLVQSVKYEFLLLFTADGRFTGSLAVRSMGPLHSAKEISLYHTEGPIKITPANTTFELIKDETIDKQAGYTNYEIIFTGVTKDTINLLYREYTPDDLARPAFYQNLTYPVDTLLIRFKQLKIKVVAVSNESIKYIVVEDK